MKSLIQKTIVVAGGTGNVGSFIVRELLLSGAQVVVPSRSEEKINSLQVHLSKSNGVNLDNLHTIIENVSDESNGDQVLTEITNSVGTPNGVISTLGGFIPAPSLLSVEVKKLHSVMDNYLYAHFAVARLFLPLFKENGGTFVFVNGPLALEPWDGAGLVSISTAAQQMLFKVLAKELEDTKAVVSELMTYAFIRNRETQPSSNVSGEAVGALASWMVSDNASDIHGQTIHLSTIKKLSELGIELNL